MSYSAVVYRLSSVRPHPNADRVQLADVHGTQVVVGLATKAGDLGVYFPCDGQLAEAFCKANNLYRERSMNADPAAPPGMFDANCRVRAQRFRGELSDGYWTPVESLAAMGLGTGGLEHGFEFDTLDGREVCRKYVNLATLHAASGGATAKKTKTARSSPMFKEHYDTPQVARELRRLDRNATLHITEKLHGTSFRVGHVLVERKGLSVVERLARWCGARVEEQEWSHLNGSRRVVLEESTGEGYHDVSIRDAAFARLRGRLRKGETVFGEIVGFEPSGKAIMGGVEVRKRDHPALHALYGEAMQYSYGCAPGESDVFVYRITLTTPCGHTQDLPWKAVKERCVELGVKHVPELGIINCGAIRTLPPEGTVVTGSVDDALAADREAFESAVLEKIVAMADGPSTLDSRHLREGVCVRSDEWPGFVGKYKSFDFKVLEGMVKDAGTVDMEESA